MSNAIFFIGKRFTVNNSGVSGLNIRPEQTEIEYPELKN